VNFSNAWKPSVINGQNDLFFEFSAQVSGLSVGYYRANTLVFSIFWHSNISNQTAVWI
jgi:hypothetical protein